MKTKYKTQEIEQLVLSRLYDRFHHLNNMRVAVSTFYTSVAIGLMILLNSNNSVLKGGYIFLLLSITLFGLAISAFEQIVHDRAIAVRLEIEDIEPTSREIKLGTDDVIFSILPFMASILPIMYLSYNHQSYKILLCVALVIGMWIGIFKKRTNNLKVIEFGRPT